MPQWHEVNTDALLVAAMADCLPEMDALTTFIERKKTIEMVVNARSDAKRLILEALKGGKHTAKAAADAWMAWRYGWQQLGRDVANVYDFIKKPVTELVVEGRSGTSISGGWTTENQTTTWLSVAFDSSHDVTYDVSYRANVVGLLKASTLNMVADPAISYWESIPFSFVADWFVNVGDVLASWRAMASFERFHCSLGRKLDLTVIGTADNLRQGSRSEYSGHGGWGISEERLTIRERVPSGVPILLPSITVNLTGPRIIDAAAMCARRIL
jgi:hypothetical protein